MPYWIAMGLIFVALIIEHVLCQSPDLVKINIAFFQMNALVGLILVIGVGASIFLPSSLEIGRDDYHVYKLEFHP